MRGYCKIRSWLFSLTTVSVTPEVNSSSTTVLTFLLYCEVRIPQNQIRTDLIEHIDIAALSLSAAGIPLPKKMEGRDILSTDYEPREAVFAARDRCGEAADSGFVQFARMSTSISVISFQSAPS